VSSIGAVSYAGGARAGALARLRRVAAHHPAAFVALVVFLIALPTLVGTHHAPRLALSRATAIRELLTDRAASAVLGHGRITHFDVLALDNHYDHVDAYDGARIVFTADVSAKGTVVAAADLHGKINAFGSGIAAEPAVLALLAATFVLMTAVWPLMRLQNLDVLASAGFVASVVLYNDVLPTPFAITSYACLAYLAARCAWRALGRARAPAPSRPLFDRLTHGIGVSAQIRLLRITLAAAALVVAMVGLSSLHVLDVGYAVMEGATVMLHGLLPYGHIPDVLHGDTYPIASYLLYVPFAALTPVHNAWGDADWTLAVALAAALLAAGLLTLAYRASWRPSRGAVGDARRLAGLRAAVAWLCFPAVIVAVSTGTTDVVLGASLLVAVLLWRYPAVSTGVLVLGAWFKLVPVALLPFALARLRRAAWPPALALIAVISVPMVLVVVALGGVSGLGAMVRAMGFQGDRTSAFTLWEHVGSVPGQQVVEAAVVALVAGAAVRMRRDGSLAGDRLQVGLLFAAVLIGLQIAADYWSFLYLVWVVPLLCLALCEPATVRRA
jgi:hypothetical protein